jgi:hypothetical protein
MTGTVVFFGGNGHCAARLAPARAAVERLSSAGAIAPFALFEVPYPGFEGRPSAPDARAFRAALAESVAFTSGRDDVVVYATGIGALLAVTLRAEGRLGAPCVLQGPVLWGLERRWMPRLARAGLAPIVPRLFRSPAFQRRFARGHFTGAPSEEAREAFFDGYAQCAATADLFRWCGPFWLREVEAAVAGRTGRLARIEVWWGGRDRVVGSAELGWTARALGVRWPERRFPAWGHYPMIDDPEGWARTVATTVAREATVMIGR